MTDNLNPEGFDLDAWIDGVERPTIIVDLFPFEGEFAARVADIEAKIDAAEKVSAENRGMTDASPEVLAAQLDELRREREAKTVRVRNLKDNSETPHTVTVSYSGKAEKL